MERLNQTGVKIGVISLLCIILLVALFCGLEGKAKKAEKELNALQKEEQTLEQDLATAKADYEKKYSTIINDNYDSDFDKMKTDMNKLYKVCDLAFNYDSKEVYDNNREKCLEYMNEDLPFMQEIFFKDEVYKSNDGEKHSLFEDMGIHRKISDCDVYYKDTKNNVSEYYIYVKCIPYFEEDVNAGDELMKEVFIIKAKLDKSGKIKSFDYVQCLPQK